MTLVGISENGLNLDSSCSIEECDINCEDNILHLLFLERKYSNAMIIIDERSPYVT